MNTTILEDNIRVCIKNLKCLILIKSSEMSTICKILVQHEASLVAEIEFLDTQL